VIKPGKFYRRRKRCQDLCWKVHERAQTFSVLRSYAIHELRSHTFLLVSSSVRSKQLLCFVRSQGQKRQQKHTTKTFPELHSHYHQSINYKRTILWMGLSVKNIIIEEGVFI